MRGRLVAALLVASAALPASAWAQEPETLPFPKVPAPALPAAVPVDPGASGPYETRTVQIDVAMPTGKTRPIVVYLPIGAPEPPPTVLIVHGFLARGGPHGNFKQLAQHLASRGFAAALYWAPSSTEFDLNHWHDDVKATIDALEAANGEAASPLHGKLDFTRFGLTGHSNGGAASISLANDPRVRAVAAFAPGVSFMNPWHPTRSPKKDFFDSAKDARARVLVIGDEFDTVVGRQWRDAYDLLPGEKEFVEIKGGEHMNFMELPFGFKFAYPVPSFMIPDHPTKDFPFPYVKWAGNGKGERDTSWRYATAWLEHYLSGRADEGGYTDGREAEIDLFTGTLTDEDVRPREGMAQKLEDPSRTRPRAHATAGGATGGW